MAAIVGTGGSVTFSSGYVANVHRWSVSDETTLAETSSFASTADRREFAATMSSATGSYVCRVDGTTTITKSGTSGAATFTLESGYTLAGTIIITGYSLEVPFDGVAEITYNFTISGDYTLTNA
jgi:hypothetical protein